MSDDKPTIEPTSALESIKQDKLGRATFVKAFSSAIRGYKGKKSLTFGLHGPWGSGKSTLLNFVVEELSQDGDLIVERFNPWNFSDQNRLLTSFFTFFGTALRKNDKAKQFERIADTLDGLADVASVVKIVDVGGVIKFGAKYAREKVKKLSDIENVKEYISKVLRDSKKRVVIIMDDLDRLNEEEIRQVFQLVKAGADFDNVIYVLAFEREIVARALDKVSNGAGERYLEKVVNIAINVPQMTKRQIRQLVFQSLNEYSNRHSEYSWDNERLGSILETLTTYFRTVRLIGMLNNLLTVVETLIQDEVDYTDHVSITMLQILEPKLHLFISENPDLFVDVLSNQFARPDELDKTDKAKITDALAKDLQTLNQDHAVEVLGLLFPKVASLFGSSSGKDRKWGLRSWIKTKRVCADFEIFSRYFRFEVDASDLSIKDLASIRASTTERDKISAILTSAAGDPDRLNRVFGGIADLADDNLSVSEAFNIISAMMDVADDLPDRVGLSAIFFSPILEALRAMQGILRSIPNASDRARVMMDALSAPPRGTSTPVQAVERFTSTGTDRSTPQMFSNEDSEALRNQAAQLIRTRFENNTLFDVPHAARVFYSWLRLAPGKSIVDIRTLVAGDDERFLKFTALLTNVTLAASPNPVPMDLNTLEKIIPRDEIKTRLEHIRDKSRRWDSLDDFPPSERDPQRGEASRLLNLFEKARSGASSDDEDQDSSPSGK